MAEVKILPKDFIKIGDKLTHKVYNSESLSMAELIIFELYKQYIKDGVEILDEYSRLTITL